MPTFSKRTHQPRMSCTTSFIARWPLARAELAAMKMKRASREGLKTARGLQQDERAGWRYRAVEKW
jgi:hypothetical protein